MAKRKTNEKRDSFVKFVKQMAEEKRLDESIIVNALDEAFRITVSKKIENSYLDINPLQQGKKKVNKKFIDENQEVQKLPDAKVRCNIDLDKGVIEIFRQFDVLNDDDITDDFIQIASDDPKVQALGLKVGDVYEEEIPLESFTIGDVTKFIGLFNQAISRSEKEVLKEMFADKIHTIVNGTVEKADPTQVIVNIGGGKEGAIAYLRKNDLIGNEKFNNGDPIKVYVQGIGDKKSEKQEGLISISRSCPGYLEELFKQEVHEIYEGSVEIKGIARRAGIRSKVAVYAKDKNVDPSGACIGPNGSRINAIVSQLGKAKDSKEKIDIVAYSDNLGVYMAECLKPGTVLGMNIDIKEDGSKEALVICANETSNLAIGNRGTNVILTKELLGFSVIRVIDENEAKEQGIEYKTIAEYQYEARQAEIEKTREESIKARAEQVKVAPVTEEAKKDDNFNYLDKDEDEKLDEEIIEEVNNEAEEVSVNEPINEAPKKVEEPVETREVKVKISLEDLESNLEAKKKDNTQTSYKKKKKYEDKEEEKPVDNSSKNEETKSSDKKVNNFTPVYTEEEYAAEFEDEEDLDEESYEDYDDDSLYDEDK